MLISTPKEFSFSECLKFLGRSAKEKLHFIENDKIIKPVKIQNSVVLMELGSASVQSIEVKFLNGAPNQSIQKKVNDYVREWFDLSTNLAAFYAMAKNDKLLKKLVARHYGLRLLKIHDLFQALCWAITGQQINLRFAYTLYGRFIESFGEKFDHRSKSYWFFPTPEIIANLSVPDLMELQFTGKKSEYIIGVAQNIANGEMTKESLLELGDFETAKNTLVKIRGIGPWTANYVLMRCLGFRSAFPIEDVGLHNAIRLQLNLDQKPTIEAIRKLSAGWTNWQAYATFYLYRSLL